MKVRTLVGTTVGWCQCKLRYSLDNFLYSKTRCAQLSPLFVLIFVPRMYLVSSLVSGGGGETGRDRAGLVEHQGGTFGFPRTAPSFAPLACLTLCLSQ